MLKNLEVKYSLLSCVWQAIHCKSSTASCVFLFTSVNANAQNIWISLRFLASFLPMKSRVWFHFEMLFNEFLVYFVSSDPSMFIYLSWVDSWCLIVLKYLWKCSFHLPLHAEVIFCQVCAMRCTNVYESKPEFSSPLEEFNSIFSIFRLHLANYAVLR